MQFIASGKPNNKYTLGLLGYLIISNKQIHSYQLIALEDYLGSIECAVTEPVLEDILSGSENAISYAASLTSFESECVEIKKDIYYMLVVLASVDDSVDKDEERILSDAWMRLPLDDIEKDNLRRKAIEHAYEIRKTHNTLFVHKKTAVIAKHNWFQRLFRVNSNFFRSLFCRKKEDNTKTDTDQKETAYNSSIEKCSITANEDFESLAPIYAQIIESCYRTLNAAKEYREALSLENKYSAETASVFDNFIGILEKDILKQCKQTQESLEQKRRTVSDFTISLLGRTKAGKSTLYTVLTNQGRDKIGAGRQRTTRYNRVYQWNLLRLIDTPGIGSAEAAGRADDEIARSVLGESDIICFVVVDDSILQDILEFIEKTSKLNKPILILLNHKENIRPEVKYKRFKNKPREWLETEGEANLTGHMARIKKYADDRGFGSLIKIFPVFLLPALMSSEQEYVEDSNLLWDSSNIDSFIDQLQKWIIDCGSIKRSQTILDEAIQVFNQSKGEISSAEGLFDKQYQKLRQQRAKKIYELKELEKETCQRIKDLLEEKFDRLATQDALRFAEEECGKTKDHAEHWNQYIEKIGFEEEVRDAVSQIIQVYSEKVSDITTALFEDLIYSAKITIDAHNINIPILFDFRAAANIAGGIAGAVGATLLLILGNMNPIGWVITAVGMVLGIGATLFSTKEQRRQKNISKIYETVKESVNKNAPAAICQILAESEKSLSSYTRQIDMIFADLENSMMEARAIASELKQNYGIQIEKLNRLYAYRLIKFINKQNSSEFSQTDILDVDRSQPGIIVIKTTGAIDPIESYSLEGIIAEKIYVERSAS